MSMSNYIFCYVHLTDRFRVLYGWASVFPIIGSISLTSFLTITFSLTTNKTPCQKLLIPIPIDLLSEKTFGLFQSLIECIYRHLILDIEPWTNLNIKEALKLRWNRVNICSSFTINISQQISITLRREIREKGLFPRIGRISLDNRTNIYLSHSKWDSTKVSWKECK